MRPTRDAFIQAAVIGGRDEFIRTRCLKLADAPE